LAVKSNIAMNSVKLRVPPKPGRMPGLRTSECPASGFSGILLPGFWTFLRIWVQTWLVVWGLTGWCIDNVHADSTSQASPCFFKDNSGRIKDILIHGAFPLFARDILGTMTIHIGPVLDTNSLPEQKRNIESYLESQGFIHPEVTIQVDEDDTDHNFVIQIHIDKGRYIHLKNIRITGNASFSTLRLKSMMTTWKKAMLPSVSGRLIHADLQKDVQDLTTFYRKQGYLDVSIGFTVILSPEQPSEADIEITVTEGTHYRFEWKGRSAFSAASLQEDLIFWENGQINDISIKRSIRKIRNRYLQAGYLNPQIVFRKNQDTPETLPAENVYEILITEGPQTKIQGVQISGNDNVPSSEIDKQILSVPGAIFQPGMLVQETVDEDVKAISDLYFSQGFRHADIASDISLSADHTQADIQFHIDEGNRTMVSEISISGLQSLSKKAALDALSLKSGKYFFEDLLENDKNKLTEMISETGHPHVQVEAEVILTDTPFQVKIAYRIDEGGFVFMGDVIVSGNLTTQERILKKEMAIQPGEPFSLKKILQSQKNIRNMDIVRSVQFQSCGLKEKADRVDLIIEIEEAKPYVFDIGVGYETEKGMFVHSRFENRNFRGANIKSWAEGEVSQIGYKGEAGLTEPRLLASRITADALVYAEDRSEFNQSFGVRIFGSSLAVSRKWGTQFSTGIAFNAEQRQLYENNDLFSESFQTQYLTENGLAPRSLMMLSPKLQFDSRDSFVRPRKGIFAAGYADISRGIGGDLDHFLRYRLDTRYYLSPLNRLTFAFSARWGYIEPKNSSNIIANDQLFYLGGSANVRGFDENMLRFDTNNQPIGALSSLSGTVEARIDLGNQIELCLFTDTGSLSRYQTDTIPDGFRSSAGLGFRYLTPVGPIGLVYGFKLDREPGENPGRFHVSIGYTF
jgi:outer membrane protein insertion porin family